MITGALEEKIAAYRDGGVEPLLGGTLFEYAYLYNRVEDLLAIAGETKLHLEISDGTLDIPLEDKLKWIEKFAARTEVFSEIGGKVRQHNKNWSEVVKQEFAAGAKMLVVEGREVGPVGQEIREDVVDTIVEAAGGPEKLIFESLERKQQLFFIKKIGPNVNLANIRTGDVLTLESFRRGLKEHTLRHTWETHYREE
jgi:phosphosulfolactate synthase